MKFRFYIVYVDTGDLPYVEGTNDERKARLVASELHDVVIDAEKGEQLTECSTDPIIIQSK